MNPDMEERLIDPTNMGQLTDKMTASKKAFLLLIALNITTADVSLTIL